MKARWKKLREIYVASDKKAENERTEMQKLINGKCSFLKPHIKHQKNKSTVETPIVESNTQQEESNDGINDGDMEFQMPNIEFPKGSTFGYEEEWLEAHAEEDSTHSVEDPMDHAAEHAADLEELINEVNNSTNKNSKRDAVENLERDFPKKMKKATDNDSNVLESQIASISSQLDEMMDKCEAVSKAQARALLISYYLDQLTLTNQLLCLREVLDIFKRYRRPT